MTTTSSDYASGPAAQPQPFVAVAPSQHYLSTAGRASDRWPWVAVVSIAAVAAIAVAFIMTMRHDQHSGVSTVAQVAAHPSAPPKVVTRKVAGPSRTIIREVPASNPAASGSGSAAASCGGGIGVNSHTSCAFAQNVVTQYTQQAQQAGTPGSFDVYAYSPVTGQSYTDGCSYNWSTDIVSCSHGSDLIQFAYGSSSEPVSRPAASAPISASGSCGGINLNSQTSCAFAQNVVAQYTQQAQRAGAPSSTDVYAYSPVTGQSYTDSCSYNSSTDIVSCSHGSDLVQFAYGSR